MTELIHLDPDLRDYAQEHPDLGEWEVVLAVLDQLRAQRDAYRTGLLRAQEVLAQLVQPYTSALARIEGLLEELDDR
jgi:hypothetical protein